MRFFARPPIAVFLICLTWSAGSRASTLAELGDTQMLAVAAILGALLAISLAAFAAVALRASRLRDQVARLEHSIAQHRKTTQILREAHEEMESKVRDRTADLEMSYQKLNDVRDSLAAANLRLDAVARVDDLTGIANRPQFDETLRKEIKRSLRSRKPLSLMMVELDEFMNYRRQYGRDRADQAVRKVAAALEKTFRRAPDIVARYDDRCFGVIMPETGVRDAMRFAERLRTIVYQQCIPYPESEASDRVTASVGLTTMQPDKLYSAEDFVAAAVQALADARAAGSNSVEYGAIRSDPETEPA